MLQDVVGTLQYCCYCTHYYTLTTSTLLDVVPPVIPSDVPNAESANTASTDTGAGTHCQTRHQNTVDPASSQQHRSITWDWEHGFNLEWDLLEDFHNWCEHEQWVHGIKLCTAHTKHPHGSSMFLSQMHSFHSFLS
jgi:hypothetical protein